MASAEPNFIAHARTDKAGRLVEAGEPLAALQRRCGGEVPGDIAVPDLLELVTKASSYGLKLARKIKAYDGAHQIIAWAEVSPLADGGAEIGIANWQSVPLDLERDNHQLSRGRAIEHAIAELTARLDTAQNVLAVEVDANASDLASLQQKMRGGLGKPWTDFVILPGTAGHVQPLHWRLLDGARCRVEGSEREWRALLIPHGVPQPGSAGFELLLIADTPLASTVSPEQPRVERRKNPNQAAQYVGRELSPVLRQPISRIIANAETIRTKLAGPLADEYSSYANDIASAGQHLLGLIDDLSDLEVVEAESFTTAPDRIDLGDVARRAAGILAMRAQEKGVSLIAPQNGDSAMATGEFRRALQILLNLVGNAINYSPSGSQIWMRLDSESGVSPDAPGGENGNGAARPGRVRITVADQGPGLSQEDQAKVFNKFERLGRGGDGGSGLGLYISRRLAEAMSGSLSVESAEGQGARFTLELPGAGPASAQN